MLTVNYRRGTVAHLPKSGEYYEPIIIGERYLVRPAGTLWEVIRLTFPDKFARPREQFVAAFDTEREADAFVESIRPKCKGW